MEQTQGIIVTDKIFRCSVCENFLSRSPIKRSKAGDAICGRCDFPKLVFKDAILERALSYLRFPCMYQPFGCPAYIKFDGKDHEDECEHRQFECLYKCGWRGKFSKLVPHIEGHFKEKTTIYFNISVSENNSGDILAHRSGFKYIVKHKYEPSTQTLTYAVIYLERRLESESLCNIYIKDKGENYNKFQKKNGPCLSYPEWMKTERFNYIVLDYLVSQWDDPEHLIAAVIPDLDVNTCKSVIEEIFGMT